MKKIALSLVLATGLGLAACSQPAAEEANEAAAAAGEAAQDAGDAAKAAGDAAADATK